MRSGLRIEERNVCPVKDSKFCPPPCNQEFYWLSYLHSCVNFYRIYWCLSTFPNCTEFFSLTTQLHYRDPIQNWTKIPLDDWIWSNTPWALTHATQLMRDILKYFKTVYCKIVFSYNNILWRFYNIQLKKKP